MALDMVFRTKRQQLQADGSLSGLKYQRKLRNVMEAVTFTDIALKKE
mgnify:CR=1 FL=1